MGIVVGAAFTAVVTGLVSDIITPLIPIPGGSLAGLVWMPPYGNTLVKWGAFINAALTFFIVTSVVYFFIVRPINALVLYHKVSKEEKMASIQNQLAHAVVSSTSVDYLSTITQNAQQPLTLILLRASAIGTTLTLTISSSNDGGVTYDVLYTSPAMTGAPRVRRIFFSLNSHADDADAAAVDAAIYKAPLMSSMVKITVAASGSCTYSLDEFTSGAGME